MYAVHQDIYFSKLYNVFDASWKHYRFPSGLVFEYLKMIQDQSINIYLKMLYISEIFRKVL